MARPIHRLGTLFKTTLANVYIFGFVVFTGAKGSVSDEETVTPFRDNPNIDIERSVFRMCRFHH